MKKYKLLSKLSASFFLYAIQESLIAVAPYMILVSSIFLLNQFLHYLFFSFYANDFISLISETLKHFSPIVIIFSIAYHFSRRYEINTVISEILSFAVYSFVLLITKDTSEGINSISLPVAIDIWQLIVPIASVFVLKNLAPFTNLSLGDKLRKTYACRIFEYIYTFFVSFAVLIGFVFLIKEFGNFSLEFWQEIFSKINDKALLFIRTIFIHISWFFGIHGPRFVNALTNTKFLHNEIFKNLTFDQFYKLFAIMGGSGSGLSLLLALFINYKHNDPYINNIAEISFPFVIFNINTLLIYAVPVAYNPLFLIPFLFIPVFNLLTSFLFISLFHIHFTSVTFQWTTPVFINAWMVSSGNILLVLWQLILIIIGIIIYLPFVKKYSLVNSFDFHIKRLERNLGISEKIVAERDITTHRAFYSNLRDNIILSQTIELLSNDNLMIYYQPKVNARNLTCNHFEALIRVKMPDGSVKGPFFIPTIERAGLAPIIDYWVCLKVHSHLISWASKGFHSFVSINLHPDTLNNTEAIRKIIDLFSDEKVEFEIIERSFLDGENAKANVELLIRNGFKVSIDDFGNGFSNYLSMAFCKISSIKIDKNIIDLLRFRKGEMICEHIIKLCKSIGIESVAEGVEKREQFEKLVSMGIDYVQGFYFSPAIPYEEVMDWKIKDRHLLEFFLSRIHHGRKERPDSYEEKKGESNVEN